MLASTPEIITAQPLQRQQGPCGGLVGSQAPALAASACGRLLAESKLSLLGTVACVGKGGAGKSSMNINLAVTAQKAGLRVGIIDADPQKSIFEWRLMRGDSDIPVHRCSPDRLPEAVDAAKRSGVQLLFIDMPPDSRYALAAARCSDLVLIPMRPTLFDLKVTQGLIQLLQSARADYAVVINAAPPLRREGDSPMVRETRDALAEIGARLWRRQITHRLAVPYAVIGGAGVIETEPDGFAAREYGALWRTVFKTLKLERSYA
jgi:chromosome partitioning protein